MTNLRRSKLLVLILMLLPIFQSCAEMKSWISPKSFFKTSPPVKDSSQISSRTSSRQAANLVKKHSVKTSAPVKDSSQISGQTPSQAANLAKKHKDFSQTSSQTPAQAANPAKEHMEAGEYQKAIDVYNVEYQKHPHDLSLAREYVKSIKNIASTADKALDEKDFSSAGRNYDVLLKNYAHFKGFEKKLSFNSIYLNEKFSDCKKAIFKQGFQEYRKGNLSEAIALWQDLLVIDPQNTDIKKTLRTAKLQQKNLQENE